MFLRNGDDGFGLTDTHDKHLTKLPLAPDQRALVHSRGGFHCSTFLFACSPKADTALANMQTTSSAGDGIVIVREKRHDYPEKFVAAVKELQSRCFEAKAVVAQAQGWAYDPSSETMTDAEIAQLDTERIAEYFEGKRYAKLVSGVRMDASKLEPTRDGSCKPLPVLFKSVEVHDGKCNVSRAFYDQASSTGRRELLKDACTSPAKPPHKTATPYRCLVPPHSANGRPN